MFCTIKTEGELPNTIGNGNCAAKEDNRRQEDTPNAVN